MMIEDHSFFSIVIVGCMNPLIHQPLWYRHFQLISEEETKEAVEPPNSFAIPPVSQIQIGAFKIVCHQDRWEIQTTIASNLNRIRNIAERVFDDLLPHTPVTRFGLNFNHIRPTTRKDVGAFLASRLIESSFGFDPSDASWGEATLRRISEDHTSTVILNAHDGEQVAVSNNFEYPLVNLAKDAIVYFKLAEKFDLTIERHRMEAQRQVEATVRAIDESTGG